jgi:hypothetical protein
MDRIARRCELANAADVVTVRGSVMDKEMPRVSSGAITKLVAVVLLVGYGAIPFAILPKVCLPKEIPKAVSYKLVIDGEQSQANSSAPQLKGEIKAAPTTLQGKIKASGLAEPIDEPTKVRIVGWLQGFSCEFNIGDFAVGLFTLLLGIATYFLWRETERLARGADDQAEKMERSIEAANASVEALKMTEMARIYVTRINLESIKSGINLAPKFRVYFRNYGKTPGFIHSTTLKFALANKRKSLAEIEPSGTRGGTYQNSFMLPPNYEDPGHTDTYGNDALAANEYARMAQDGTGEQLFVWGHVKFSPVFGETWASHFAYRINLTPNAAQKNVTVGGAEYWRYYKLD